MSKTLKKKNHWTNKVHETVLSKNAECELGFELKGGAENGQFPHLGEAKQVKVACQSGKLSQDELLLEVNDTPVAGLTIRDVFAVIKHSKDPVRLKCVKQDTRIRRGQAKGKLHTQSQPQRGELASIASKPVFPGRSRAWRTLCLSQELHGFRTKAGLGRVPVSLPCHQGFPSLGLGLAHQGLRISP
ncbi:hypothetical protein SKAU_G00047890 [Synaphobranchus kaupii]|uniref:PDZ domain-containing protein n=1 Tax=Synaphobranchus kaupii TaxID=118154 RepID=A0A9Q1G2G3_SYNKA|nr:hypothetical protein SKAU_G00047890 [Synaphobranchus kaupii]